MLILPLECNSKAKYILGCFFKFSDDRSAIPQGIFFESSNLYVWKSRKCFYVARLTKAVDSIHRKMN